MPARMALWRRPVLAELGSRPFGINELKLKALLFP
jgi:hypothetical protein